MNPNILDIKKQIYADDLLNVLEKKYSTIGPIWVSHQMEWMNGIYSSFKDHDKFLILIFLVKKTLDFYSRNFIKLRYEDFYLRDTVEIEKFSIAEISQALDIPKESTRRKVLELENDGAIKRGKKTLKIDRSKFFYSKPEKSIKRVSRFLAVLSELCEGEKTLSNRVTSEEFELIIKNNFSYVWKIYYELQIPMVISYKKFFKDIETFHIYGICVVNQHLFARNISEDYMNRSEFINSFFNMNKMQGINAMSISDITGIPRATVTRKLKRLLKLKHLIIDDKKLYKLTGNYSKKLLTTQAEALTKLANFSSKIFNIHLLNKKNIISGKKKNIYKFHVK